MLERSETVLKIVCAGLAALVLYQVATLARRTDPLAHIKIPVVPTLASTSNSPAAKPGTNSVATQASGKLATNSAPAKGTNAPVRGTNTVGERTNATVASTNAVAKATNSLAKTSNAVVQPTNIASAAVNSDSRVASSAARSAASAAAARAGRGGAAMAMPGRGMPPGMGGPPGGRGPALPPEIQARVDRIVQSELLGPVMRPLPMALLGIAGRDAVLRAPNGQTGLVREGGELGGVKLLRIGINRVLIELEGKQQELTVFSGFGGETLLPKGKENQP